MYCVRTSLKDTGKSANQDCSEMRNKGVLTILTSFEDYFLEISVRQKICDRLFEKKNEKNLSKTKLVRNEG